ncbi:hypothetical protein GC176_05150 [bacterium]|nr:hypothetical protein [bacterium]
MRLFQRLWRDEVGLVVSAETMIVGTVGVIGAVAGIATATSAVNDELLQLGQAFRGFNQSYSISGTNVSMRGGLGGAPGMTAVSNGAASSFAVTTGASGFQQADPRIDMQAAQTQYLQTVGVTAQAFGVQSDVCGQAAVPAQTLGTIGKVYVQPQSQLQTLPARPY